MLSSAIQWLIVGASVAAAVFFIVRLFRKSNSGCGDCPLKDACSKTKKEK